MGFYGIHPLVITNIAIEMTIDIVSFFIKKTKTMLNTDKYIEIPLAINQAFTREFAHFHVTDVNRTHVSITYIYMYIHMFMLSPSNPDVNPSQSHETNTTKPQC